MNINRKRILYIAFASIALAISAAVITDRYVNETSGEITVQSAEEAKLNYFERKTRASSLKIVTPSGGHGTGTLIKYDGRLVIFTAAHVTSQGPMYLAIDQWGEQQLAVLVYQDREADFAVLVVEDFQKTRPTKFKLPKYNIRESVDREVVFSGFPSRHDLLTMRGAIAGYQGDSVIVHSSAWGGSSGSGIFDESGAFIGILYAVSIGNSLSGPAIMENFIWIMPFDKIKWSNLDSALDAI